MIIDESTFNKMPQTLKDLFVVARNPAAEEVEAEFAKFGESKPKEARTGVRGGSNPAHMSRDKKDNSNQGNQGFWPADSGGTASRFFYCAKANTSDRAGSKHPTVKPLALIRHLVTMITPPGGRVLDPFAGSGTTLQAAYECGFHGVGIEMESESYADIQERIRRMAA